MTQLKNLNYDNLVVPNTFWCTFKEGKAAEKAKELKEIRFNKVEPKLWHSIPIRQAHSPSDMNMLNRGVNKQTQCFRGIIIVLIIITIAICSTYVFAAEL